MCLTVEKSVLKLCKFIYTLDLKEGALKHDLNCMWKLLDDLLKNLNRNFANGFVIFLDCFHENGFTLLLLSSLIIFEPGFECLKGCSALVLWH